MADSSTVSTSDAQLTVIAVDASNHSFNAFKYYVDNLHRDTNRVVLLFCPELSNVALQLLKGQQAPYEQWNKIMDKERKQWTELQDSYQTLFSRYGLKNACFEIAASKHNKPGEAITQYVEQEKAVLVVLGSRGEGKIKRTLMGSVSDYVLNHAHCPVLICKKD